MILIKRLMGWVEWIKIDKITPLIQIMDIKEFKWSSEKLHGLI